MVDELETDILAGAIAALRRRAALQRKRAADYGAGSGEAAIALRLAAAFDELVDEFERPARRHGVYTFPDGTTFDSETNVSTRPDGSTFEGGPDLRAAALP